MRGFELSRTTIAAKTQLLLWAQWLDTPEAQTQTEESVLPEFLNDIFGKLLGYRGPVTDEAGHTMSREQFVEVDGSFADAVLGRYGLGADKHVVAVEGKAPRDPLDRPFAGRRLSAVEQAYRYAINLPSDWILVTNLRELRLYHKGSDQRTLERFDTKAMAFDERQLRRFVYLLSAERVVAADESCHLDELRSVSLRAEVDLTRSFYTEYAELRRNLLRALTSANSHLHGPQALAATQRFLDRVLFVAFCEDRGLLPADTLKRAWGHRDPYNPRPVWDNFRGLFQAIDRGSDALAIPAYDGGLFVHDAVLDELTVPDAACELLKRLGEFDFRTPDRVAILEEEGHGPPVDVEILGHIFEQSISDLEELSGTLEAGDAVAAKSLSTRHRQGAFYTPAFITRHIVRETVGVVVSERFRGLQERHRAAAESAGTTAAAVLREPRSYDADLLNEPQRQALIRFWTEWLAELATIRVLDPACGSGAFLIEAFDQLYAEYATAIGYLDELRRTRGLYDPDRSILRNNLFGVDLSPEAVEICRLSIWIKTAQPRRQLTALDDSIKVGNSIVSDSEVDPRALNWAGAFPDVIAAGGFDVVIGNPPYVRQELLGPIKPHLEGRYAAYHGMADLYVYFFERGLELLRPGGRLGFVVTNKWLKTGYAAPLRGLLAERAWLRSVVDLGHAKQVFPDADVFPSIVVLQRPEATAAPNEASACVIPREEVRIDDLSEQIRSSGFSIARASLGSDAWCLDPPEVAELMRIIRERGVPLAEYCGSKPYYGVKTGCNEAFLIDQATRDRLVAEDPRSADIIKPYLRGQDIERWHADWQALWMMALKSSGDRRSPWSDLDEHLAEGVFGERLPSIHRHLKPFEEKLRRRQDKGKYWWELRTCSYYELLEGAKILYQEIQFSPAFAFDPAERFCNNKVFLLPTSDLWLLGVLNSPLVWWYNWRHLVHLKDEALSPQGFKMEALPIAPPVPAMRSEAEDAAHQLVEFTRERQEQSRLLTDWLRIEHGLEKAPKALRDPFSLSEENWIEALRAARGRRRPLSASGLRAARDEYHASIAPIQAHHQKVVLLERRLSDLVNAAYGLTPAQVDLLWRTAPPRMPITPDGPPSTEETDPR